MSDIYKGDAALDRLLERANSSWNAAALTDLVRGVLAAPKPIGPEVWTGLLDVSIGPDLESQLRAFHHEITKRSQTNDAGVPCGPARLLALRAQLKERGSNGFIVPRGDEYQGEYVPKRAERLAWLTGFTGSAGLAVVLENKAAVFVDGRYILQAQEEVDGKHFDRFLMAEHPASGWIAANLSKGGRLGYDPWLLTPNQVERYEAACAKAGGVLVATRDNPLDAVWKDQPPPPLAPVTAHDLAFAGEASVDKRRRLARTLSEDGIDAVVLSAPDSVAWLLNVRGGDVPYAPLPHVFAVFNSDGTVDLFVDPRKVFPGLGDHLTEDVRLSGPDSFGPFLDRLGTGRKKVCLDRDEAPAWILDRLEKAGARLVKGTDPCTLAKAAKNPVELDGMRAAHRRDGAALVRFLSWLDRRLKASPLTESEAADRLEAFRSENDHFRGLSFSTISAAGPNGAIVHYRVSPRTDRRIEPGSLYLLDSGAQYLDGTTDVTRTIAIGRPTDETRQRFTLVLKGHIAVASVLFPKGTTGSQLDPLARKALWEHGLDYEHGTGHGVGSYLSVHEGPQRISKKPSTVALEPGMIISNEPGYYKSGAYGIRIENLVAVFAVPPPEGAEKEMLGFETLTLAPIDRAMINLSLLNNRERAWMDAYHARVREVLHPLLDRDTALWLKAATRPLA